MEAFSNYPQGASLDNALTKLTAYVYDVMDGKTGQDSDTIHTCIRSVGREISAQIMCECVHKRNAEKDDTINHVRSCLVVHRDSIFHRSRALFKGQEEPGYVKALCSGLRKIEGEISGGWFVHCSKNIKVADRDTKEARHEVANKSRRLLKPLRNVLADETLALMALRPLKQFHSNRHGVVTFETFERIHDYALELEELVLAQPQASAAVFAGKRTLIDHQLLDLLRNSGYFTAGQLPEEPEEETEWEIPADSKTGKIPRLILNETIAFIAGLFRVFKGVDFIGNINMAELKRLLVSLIQTPTTEQTTEEFFDKGYKNISDHTRKNLIIFLKKCIRWLEDYKG
ncbi:hypothetical protein HNQ91_000138 [Filimonas zeae]|uniref:Uncharacterized protein n=1 Tax=Filimonas zeae TaxID=1737353 RepID=A0A917ILH9_9BACT|nr:hypothetical protein [Filimonas zeae]MDR6337116.1 hypothetical protein [Filimonas zeae]GGH57081.1 hypothetical protein GCM10011379_01360 [Filimonas zeae]